MPRVTDQQEHASVDRTDTGQYTSDFMGTSPRHWWDSTRWGSDRTGDRRATRHATGLVFGTQLMKEIRARKSKNIRVSIWPDVGAERVTCVYSHSKQGDLTASGWCEKNLDDDPDLISAKRLGGLS